jgi:hypothetical protein
VCLDHFARFIGNANHSLTFKFNKRAELFVGVDNKAPPVVAVRICNKDCLPVAIDR